MKRYRYSEWVIDISDAWIPTANDCRIIESHTFTSCSWQSFNHVTYLVVFVRSWSTNRLSIVSSFFLVSRCRESSNYFLCGLWERNCCIGQYSMVSPFFLIKHSSLILDIPKGLLALSLPPRFWLLYSWFLLPCTLSFSLRIIYKTPFVVYIPRRRPLHSAIGIDPHRIHSLLINLNRVLVSPSKTRSLFFERPSCHWVPQKHHQNR